MKIKSKQKRNKFDKYFLLSWKKLLAIVIIWFATVLLHNFWYFLFNFEEAIFFILAVIIIPLYTLISMVYTTFKTFKNKIR